MQKTGAEIFMDALKQENVEVVFGYPGAATIDIFHLFREEGAPRFVLARHEQGAGHMADGYARATGRPGVCLVTSGPGATNIATAVATANMDSVPTVFFTGQVMTSAIGNDAFQEVDVVGYTRPFCKHSYLVDRVEELPRILKEAFHIATTGRPGPVVVDLPKDVQKAVLQDYVYPAKADIRSYKPHVTGNMRQIRRAARAVERSKRPLLYVGGGANRPACAKLLVQLAEKCGIPCTTTLLGLGSFPEDHPLALEMLGMHGTQYANFAMHNCDLIIAVGARFDDRVTGKLAEFAPNREEIIHIDVDPSSISKSIPVSLPVVGDTADCLEKILAEVKPCEHKEWREQCLAWKKSHPLVYANAGDLACPQYVIDQLHEITAGDAVVVTEVGQHQMWAAQFWKFREPRTFLSSGGLGTMGYGFPAAIGAKLALPDCLVVDIAGDGSIQMNMQEMTTAVYEGIDVKVVILNNSCLGMVRQWQQMFYDGNYSGTGLRASKSIDEAAPYRPDFVRLAQAYGATGLRAKTVAEVRPTLQKMIETPGPVFAEFIVAKEENVFPMIPAGKSVDEMISGMA